MAYLTTAKSLAAEHLRKAHDDAWTAEQSHQLCMDRTTALQYIQKAEDHLAAARREINAERDRAS